ncbi:hypothetical protein QF001_003766 [Paraburkholderia youngii]|uniref:hypothetical protein n=1 Tax=Paraburkholderia youngii TaxID=2782701 RepID=UPI003D1CD181
MNVDIEVQGLAELQMFLSQLPEAIAKQMLYGALSAGARPIRDQTKANIRAMFGTSERYTGTLEAGIAVGRNRRTRYDARVDVRIRRPKSNAKTRKPSKTTGQPVFKGSGDDAYYGRILHEGSIFLKHKYPFMRLAGEAKSDEGGRKFRDTLGKQLAKHAAKNGVTFVWRG